MPRVPVSDPIPTSVREFLTAYEELLPDVRFPDVDQTFLAALVSDVEDHAALVERAKRQLEAARDALEDAQAALIDNARRALAYARVYAGGDESVHDRLEALALAEPAARAELRSRRRAPGRAGRQRARPAVTEAA